MCLYLWVVTQVHFEGGKSCSPYCARARARSLSLSHNTHAGKIAGRTSNGKSCVPVAGARASWDNFHSLDILEVKRERLGVLRENGRERVFVLERELV
jgi:hypothetical protein